jgi:hypothetical protein
VVALWLLQKLTDGMPTIVGIDHGFSFPVRYYEEHGTLLLAVRLNQKFVGLQAFHG